MDGGCSGRLYCRGEGDQSTVVSCTLCMTKHQQIWDVRGHCSWPVHCNEDVVTGVCLITNIGVWYYGQTASTGTCSCKHTIWTSDDGHIIMACTLALALLSHKNSVVFTIGHIYMLSLVVAVSTVHIVLLSCSSGPVFQFQSIAQLKVEIVHLSFHKILHCTEMNILLSSHLFLYIYRY